MIDADSVTRILLVILSPKKVNCFNIQIVINNDLFIAKSTFLCTFFLIGGIFHHPLFLFFCFIFSDFFDIIFLLFLLSQVLCGFSFSLSRNR